MDNIHTDAVSVAAAAPKTNYLFFEPKKWMKHPDFVNSTILSRFFINNPLGDGLKEVVSTGDWGYTWCEITNGMLRLERNTEYHFVFWLNGGENDKSDETCMLQILFTDNSMRAGEEDWEQRLCYRLNRAYIKPLKKYNGWELYDIPFTTNDCEYTEMRFTVQRAPMAIMEAKEPAFYAELVDRIDEFAGRRPQRHNIVFEDGWPTVNVWYSTEALRKRYGTNTRSTCFDGAGFNMDEFMKKFSNMDEFCQRVAAEVSGRVAEEIDAAEIAGIIATDYADEIMQQVRETVSGNN